MVTDSLKGAIENRRPNFANTSQRANARQELLRSLHNNSRVYLREIARHLMLSGSRETI